MRSGDLDLDLDPFEIRPGQSPMHIQKLDADDTTVLVKIKNDARAHFFRFDDRRFF